MGQSIFLPAPEAGLLPAKPRGRTWGETTETVCPAAEQGFPTDKTFPFPARWLPGASSHPRGCERDSCRAGCQANAEPVTQQSRGLGAPPVWMHCWKRKTNPEVAQRVGFWGALGRERAPITTW